MKISNEFENILDQCLERLVTGETIEQCLLSYPEQAFELEPLLRTAQAAREASAILPRADFKARARYEFQAALHDAVGNKKQPRFSLRRGWVLSLLIVGILLVSGGGTALAASGSMPDSPFYQVKLTTEQVQLNLTPSPIAKAELCASFVDRRVTEIIYLAAKGDAAQMETVTRNMDERLTTLAGLVSTGNDDAVGAVTAGEPPRLLTEEPEMTPAAPEPSQATETVPLSPTPAEESAPPPEADANNGNGKAAAEDGDRAKLKTTVADQALTNTDALREVLELAPTSVKSALNRALTVSENGYGKALAAMD